MVSESICAVCGNDVDSVLVRCPFCNEAREPVYVIEAVEQFRVINLERGMPLVQDALKRLAQEMEIASRNDCRALVLIHGYGSSGKGGAIKDAVREQLQLSLDRKILTQVLPGEKCGKRFGPTRQFIKRFPFLEEFVRNPNPGLTFVIF